MVALARTPAICLSTAAGCSPVHTVQAHKPFAMGLKPTHLVLLLLLVALPAHAQEDSYGSASAASADNTTAPGSASGTVNISQVAQAVARAMREPTPHVFTLRTEYNAGGSQISVGEDSAANTLTVVFRFNACTGTQLHHHSNLEQMLAVNGSSVQVGVISPSSQYSTFNFTAGQAMVIPAGYVHYYLNQGCDTAVLVATWPAGTKTTFELLMLQAVPPALLGGVLATSDAAPQAKPGFPIIQDAECVRRCGAAAANASSPPPAG